MQARCLHSTYPENHFVSPLQPSAFGLQPLIRTPHSALRNLLPRPSPALLRTLVRNPESAFRNPRDWGATVSLWPGGGGIVVGIPGLSEDFLRPVERGGDLPAGIGQLAFLEA